MHSNLSPAFGRKLADDTFAILKKPAHIERFNILSGIFCNGTNMRENVDKREMLAIGNLQGADPMTFPGKKIFCKEKKKMVNQGWKSGDEWVISLGVPIGNRLGDGFAFLQGIYTKAKSILSKVQGIQTMHITGRHRILNANYYGKFRYWMWSMHLPETLLKAIEADARQFLWKRDPNLDADALGSHDHLGKWIKKGAEFKAVRRGGLGIMHLRNHVRAFKAQWVLKLFHPRKATWQQIVSHWLHVL